MEQVRCLGVICGATATCRRPLTPPSAPSESPCVITPSSSAFSTSSSLSPSCSSWHGLAPSRPAPAPSSLRLHAGYVRPPCASAPPRSHVTTRFTCRALCCLLKLPQLYAGCLYIHSNLTDRLGNAAPAPRLFLLQVPQSTCTRTHTSRNP